MKNNQIFSRIIIILSLLILVIISYVFFYKSSELKENSLYERKTISFSIYKHKLEKLADNVKILESEDQEEQIESENPQIIDWQTQPIITIILDRVGMTNSDLSTLPYEINLVRDFHEQSVDDNLYKMHTTLWSIPLQTEENYLDDQTHLFNKETKEENLSKLENLLNKLKDNSFIYSSKDEVFTNNEESAELLISALKRSKILYLSAKTDTASVIYKIAEKNSFDIVKNDVILDEVISKESISKNLFKLEEIAKTKGHAVAVASAYPLTIDLLSKWLLTLEERGIKIMSIGDFYAIMKQRKEQNN